MDGFEEAFLNAPLNNEDCNFIPFTQDTWIEDLNFLDDFMQMNTQGIDSTCSYLNINQDFNVTSSDTSEAGSPFSDIDFPLIDCNVYSAFSFQEQETTIHQDNINFATTDPFTPQPLFSNPNQILLDNSVVQNNPNLNFNPNSIKTNNYSIPNLQTQQQNYQQHNHLQQNHPQQQNYPQQQQQLTSPQPLEVQLKGKKGASDIRKGVPRNLSLHFTTPTRPEPPLLYYHLWPNKPKSGGTAAAPYYLLSIQIFSSSQQNITTHDILHVPPLHSGSTIQIKPLMNSSESNNNSLLFSCFCEIQIIFQTKIDVGSTLSCSIASSLSPSTVLFFKLASLSSDSTRFKTRSTSSCFRRLGEKIRK